VHGFAWQVNVLGLSAPLMQLNVATLGVYPRAHRVVHEDPELIWDPSLQEPLVSSFATVGAVHGFTWQMNVVGLSMSSSQINDATLGVYPHTHCVVHEDP
jgi:hypothetical protein